MKIIINNLKTSNSIAKCYALWNNKDGVGKSTISFYLSMRYAEIHSNVKVLVANLRHQSNFSMMFLGGGRQK